MIYNMWCVFIADSVSRARCVLHVLPYSCVFIHDTYSIFICDLIYVIYNEYFLCNIMCMLYDMWCVFTADLISWARCVLHVPPSSYVFIHDSYSIFICDLIYVIYNEYFLCNKVCMLYDMWCVFTADLISSARCVLHVPPLISVFIHDTYSIFICDLIYVIYEM